MFGRVTDNMALLQWMIVTDHASTLYRSLLFMFLIFIWAYSTVKNVTYFSATFVHSCQL